MADQASLGAGVLQTAMRLSISLGLAISTAVYGRSSTDDMPLDPLDAATTRPYTHALLCAVAFAAVGLCFTPFMRINTKEAPSCPPVVSEKMPRREKIRTLFDHRHAYDRYRVPNLPSPTPLSNRTSSSAPSNATVSTEKKLAVDQVTTPVETDELQEKQ